MELFFAGFFATWIMLVVTFAVVRSFDEIEKKKVEAIYKSILETEKHLAEKLYKTEERFTQKITDAENSFKMKIEFFKNELADTLKTVEEAKRMMNNTKIANNLVTRVRKDTHGA